MKSWPTELKRGLGKIRDSGGIFAYQVTNFLQRVQVLKRSNFMISKYLDNFNNSIIFIVFVDLHWYAYYVNMSVR